MVLFINHDRHENLFKSDEKITTQNQTYFRSDYLSELLKEQQMINYSLYETMNELSDLMSQQGQTQTNQWSKMEDQLINLEEMNQDHKKVEKYTTSQLDRLINHTMSLQNNLKNDRIAKEDYREHLNLLTQTNQKISADIEGLTLKNDHLSNQLSSQEKSQKQVINRLEHQEAKMEKMIRQMNNFRSLLFERTNDLAETIEESFHLTSTYFYQALNGFDQSSLTMLLNNGNKDGSTNRKE